MLISKEINNSLHEMISIELTAVKQYMAIGAKLKELGYEKIGDHFLMESSEEQSHALKLIDFLIRVGAEIKLLGDKNFKQEFKNAEDMIETALKMENDYYKFQNDLVNKVKEVKDNLTENFLTWYLENQVEEINELRDLLTKIKKLGDDKLFLLDQMFSKGA
jgi:ferritin